MRSVSPLLAERHDRAKEWIKLFCKADDGSKDRGKRTAALAPVSQRAFRGLRAKAGAIAPAVERKEGNRGLIA